MVGSYLRGIARPMAVKAPLLRPSRRWPLRAGEGRPPAPETAAGPARVDETAPVERNARLPESSAPTLPRAEMVATPAPAAHAAAARAETTRPSTVSSPLPARVTQAERTAAVSTAPDRSPRFEPAVEEIPATRTAISPAAPSRARSNASEAETPVAVQSSIVPALDADRHAPAEIPSQFHDKGAPLPPRTAAPSPPEPVARRKRPAPQPAGQFAEPAIVPGAQRVASPRALRQGKSQAEESHTLTIGTIEVHVSAPTPPIRPAAPAARPAPAPSRGTTALGRGYTSPFGLRQG